MKKITLTLLLLLLSTLCSIAQTSGLNFLKPTHNFGKIQENGGMVFHNFQYTNTSGKNIVIIDVQSSCGCTVPSYSRSEIKPNQSGEIKISFDPNFRPGRIDKAIRVVTNLGEQILHIDGVVNPRERPLEELFPFALHSGVRMDRFAISGVSVPINSVAEVKMTVANSSYLYPVYFNVDNFSLPQEISATVTESILKTRGNSEITFKIKGTKYGKFNYQVRFLINGAHSTETLQIDGVVVDNFSTLSKLELMNAPKIVLSQNYMNLGRMEIEAKTELSVMVRNNGKSPLIIRSITSSKSIVVSADSMEVQPGGSTFLRMSYSPRIEGYDTGIVTLITNDPSRPIIEVRTMAEVF